MTVEMETIIFSLQNWVDNVTKDRGSEADCAIMAYGADFRLNQLKAWIKYLKSISSENITNGE